MVQVVDILLLPSPAQHLLHEIVERLRPCAGGQQ